MIEMSRRKSETTLAIGSGAVEFLVGSAGVLDASMATRDADS
jgi:hypothetical protein